MAAPEQELPPDDVVDDDDSFTFPTPPQLVAAALEVDGGQLFHQRGGARLPLPRSSPSSPPAWLLSSPIRRSFSAADCAASPWRGACSPALSDYEEQGDEEEEERMDGLWEDLNDADGAPPAAAAAGRKEEDSHDVSRRRSVVIGGGARQAERRKATKADEREVLGASRSSRRRPPGLVAMMRALKKMLVAHKGKSKVHKADEQSAAASAFSGKKW